MNSMRRPDSHLSDERLLMDLDGELSFGEAKQSAAHLSECWRCRARRQELESTISGFVRAYERENHGLLPPATGPRALLKAQLADLSKRDIQESEQRFPVGRGFIWALAAAAFVIVCVQVLLVRSSLNRKSGERPTTVIVSVPDSRLTPGATLLLSRKAVCAATGTNNKDVPVSMRRKVFEAYGMQRAQPKDYEVDYLITPALGGTDDVHNLWPESHSETVWNAEVKDALEERLRNLVCDGTLDLPEAQQEIAVNWIAAYKKYFHTDKPLAEHYKQAFP